MKSDHLIQIVEIKMTDIVATNIYATRLTHVSDHLQQTNHYPMP